MAGSGRALTHFTQTVERWELFIKPGVEKLGQVSQGELSYPEIK